MQITPRYDGAPVVRVEGVGPEIGALVVAQRRRLGAALEDLDDAQWTSPTRCEGWAVRDVISHLVTTNQFWTISLGKGFAGEPTRFLVGFDPVASPAQLVDAERDLPAAEVYERYRTSCAALADLLEQATPEQWELPAEAPPGHLAASAVALHALWDAWVHERDILLPLGRTPIEDAAEVAACLRYAAGLGPGFLASAGRPASGEVAVRSDQPDLALVVHLGDTVVVEEAVAPAGTPTLEGDAVALVEALSIRSPFPAGAPREVVASLRGLEEVFDQA